MIYQFTGQPGHGKTLHAILLAMEFKDKGRAVFVCNVRQFDYEKTGMQRMTPDDFKNWMEFLPDGAVALVDECYEHGMLPKRPPSSAVPPHVKELAKHRHRGIDFIFVCQSPDKQTDSFVHDLIERHTHVRRRFGTQFVHLRIFDRYEARPEKVQPLVLKRTRLPKKAMGTYQSTELETTERKVPWYFFAFAIGVPAALGFSYWVFGGMAERLTGTEPQPVAVGAGGSRATEPSGEGARAPGMSPEEFAKRFQPRIASQPWSAPAYDGLQVSQEPPRVFCMIGGSAHTGSCSCLTEQGTRYVMPVDTCRFIAVNGQYEPFRDERNARLADGYTQQAAIIESQRVAEWGAGHRPAAMGEPASRAGGAPAGSEPASPTGIGEAGELQAAYGDFRSDAK